MLEWVDPHPCHAHPNGQAGRMEPAEGSCLGIPGPSSHQEETCVPQWQRYPSRRLSAARPAWVGVNEGRAVPRPTCLPPRTEGSFPRCPSGANPTDCLPTSQGVGLG